LLVLVGWLPDRGTARGGVLTAHMEWALARERLGAELIGARESLVHGWRRALREQGATAWALDRCASELVLQAGAALADGAPGEAPWRRCGALLRIDARDQGRALATELTLLWHAMAGSLQQLALNVDEDRLVREVLGAQLEAALRGAAAALRTALLDEAPAAELRFGGPTAICFRSPVEEEPAYRAA
jgi:hypothetical protein